MHVHVLYFTIGSTDTFTVKANMLQRQLPLVSQHSLTLVLSRLRSATCHNPTLPCSVEDPITRPRIAAHRTTPPRYTLKAAYGA